MAKRHALREEDALAEDEGVEELRPPHPTRTAATVVIDAEEAVVRDDARVAAVI